MFRFAQYERIDTFLRIDMVRAAASLPAVPPACSPKTPCLQTRGMSRPTRPPRFAPPLYASVPWLAPARITAFRLPFRRSSAWTRRSCWAGPSRMGLPKRRTRRRYSTPACPQRHDPFYIDSASRSNRRGICVPAPGWSGGFAGPPRPAPPGTPRPAHRNKDRAQVAGALASRCRAGRGACRPAPAGHLRVPTA